jgi:lactonase family protein with 7-bladed beta-propeller
VAAAHPLMARARIAALAVSLLGLLAVAPAPPAVAAGNGSLTLLRGKAGCLSATTWRYKPGCARIRGLRRPGDVAVSPDGRNVYASSPISNTIAVFARSARTGALRQLHGRTGCLNPTGRYGCGRARGLRTASGIEVSGDGRNVYVQSLEALAVFRRDPRTGALRQLPGKAGCVGDRPRERSRQGCAAGRALAAQFDLTLSPSGRFVYVASGWYVESAPSQGGIAVFRRDPRRGRLAQLPGAAGCVTALGRQHCGQARSMPRLGANQVVLDRGGGTLYATASGTFTGLIVFDRRRGGGLRQLSGPAGCVSGGGAGGCTPARAFEALHGLAASPAGIDNLYASTSFSVFPGVRHGSVLNLVRDSATGALSQPAGPVGCVSWDGGGDGCASTHSQMNAVSAVAVSRDGRNVYAPLISELGGAGMIVFARNRATGELFQLPGPAGCFAHAPTPDCADSGGLAASAIALSPDGRNAYVTSGSGSPSGTGLPPYYALAVYKRAR